MCDSTAYHERHRAAKGTAGRFLGQTRPGCGGTIYNSGSAATALVLILLTVAVIAIAIRLSRPSHDPREEPAIPQLGQQVETHAFYIAQTALDRSIKELVADPRWRDGFRQISFDDGMYDVKVYGAGSGPAPASDVPPNYVRIVAFSEVEGVRKQVEAVWVDAMAAFQQAYAAGNRIELTSHGGGPVAVLGPISNNSWHQGMVDIGPAVTVYGDIKSVGDISIGHDSVDQPATVYGSVLGASVRVAEDSEIRRYLDLVERDEGLDLDGDGDAEDIGVTRSDNRIAGMTAVLSNGRPLRDGETDWRLGNGDVRVSVGHKGIGPIVDPRPDFAMYYELVTGLSHYPAPSEHVSVPIHGDGEGHYFAGAGAFFEWLKLHPLSTVNCWRCAGNGLIDPGHTTICPECLGTGEATAAEITGVFYIDDDVLDLSRLGENLVLHGTLVIAQGDPYRWPEKTIDIPGGTATIRHYPSDGRLVIEGATRMHFTQTYRSDVQGGVYRWKERTLFDGADTQVIAVPEPLDGQAMYDFPAIIAAREIVIEPRQSGFAYHPGDIGDEKLTVLQGVLFAETQISLHGPGGWDGDPLVFDEGENLTPDDVLEEPVLQTDLNGDGDTFDRVGLASVSTVPVIAVAHNRYNIDINNDGVFSRLTLGVNYRKFFEAKGYKYPILIYHEGIVMSQSIHSCEQVMVVFDPQIAASGVPFGFEVNFGTTTYQGLVSWSERAGR